MLVLAVSGVAHPAHHENTHTGLLEGGVEQWIDIVKEKRKKMEKTDLNAFPLNNLNL